ncbi:hypothetical protein [Paenibacillus sp. OAE614]|uniref:hypothetical protein n=1 Tax=Paenibacillus sp. OAE614 TaxID=2663804 RepID=UPI001789CC55
MKREVKAIRGKGTDCFQDLIITVSNHWGTDYELFFCESMEFEFNNQQGRRLGESLVSNRITTYDMSEKYHGIKMEYKEMNSSEESLDLLMKIIDEEKLAAIHLDTFYTPWHIHGSYRTVHANHTCLVVDYDHELSVLYCIDPVYSNKLETLSYNEFLKGNNGQLVVFTKEIPMELTSDAIGTILSKIKNQLETKNKIKDILIFADSLKSSFSIEYEIDGKKDIWGTKIWIELDKIIFGRYYLLRFIRYFSKHYSEIEVIEKDALLSYRKWEMVRSIITKMYYTKTSEEKNIQNMYNYLKEVYECEKNIQLFFENNYSSNLSHPKNTSNSNYVKQNSIIIPLKDYYNNKTFLVEGDNSGIEPDFNGEGRYIHLKLSDKKYFEQSIDGNDNVKCENQIIEVPKGFYNHILIYGCSEFGGCHTNLKLQYEKFSVIKDIYFSDWGEEEQLEENLKVHWKGISDEGYEKFIKQLIIPINASEELHSLQLPFYPNLHIFSIRLNTI